MATKKTKAPKKKSSAKKAAPKKTKKAPAKKAPAKKAPAKKAPAKPAPKQAKKAAAKEAVQRQDRAGHLAPKYAKDLRRLSKASAAPMEPRSFVNRGRSMDPLAEELAEEFVETVTSGEDEGTELRDGFTEEEVGGPFVSTPARREFAHGTDASNPKGSKREPFPTT
jgi:hypothetical protein